MLFAAFCLSILWGSDVEIVRLKVGEEIVVELERDTFDEAVGIDAVRVRDGAHIRLQWDQIHEDDVRRIRGSFGYLPDEPEPIMVEATRIVMTNGAEFIGLLSEVDAETFVLRQGSKEWPLRWSGVRSREPVEVDALEVYDAEQLYATRLAEAVPSTALDHYNLALYCESLQLWPRVVEHLTAASQLDPSFKPVVIGEKLKRANMRAEAGEDSELLAAAVRLANRELYDQALDTIEEYLENESGSRLRGEFERERDNILRKRQRWFMGKVSANFFGHMDRFARSIAADPEVGLQEARRQMDKEGTQYALQALAQQLNSTLEEVEATWLAEDRPRGAPRTASYGAGTFTLGEKRIFENMDGDILNPGKDKKEEEQTGTSVEERIRQMLEKRKREAEERKQQKTKKKSKFRIRDDVPPTAEEWWAEAPTTEKSQHLMAYWAEREANVELVKVFARDCVRCSGAGIIEFIDRERGLSQAPCSRCKTARIDRVIRFH